MTCRALLLLLLLLRTTAVTLILIITIATTIAGPSLSYILAYLWFVLSWCDPVCWENHRRSVAG
jgi:hypothetical protein